MAKDYFDFVVIGAGAAGLAAARWFASAKRDYIVLEASDRVGGRCITNSTRDGLRYDVGAHFLHMPEINPLYRIGASAGFDVYPAPDDYWLQHNRRAATSHDYDLFETGWERLEAAIYAHRTAATDTACGSLIPKDLGRWQHAIEFVVGPYLCGRDLDEVSAHDFATSDEREIDGLCREGFGTLLAKTSDGLKIRLSCPVVRVSESGPREFRVETLSGSVRAKAVLVTVSTAVLASNAIDFQPNLPSTYLQAACGLPLGCYERVVMTLEGNPLGADDDTLIIPSANGWRNAALVARIGGTDLAMLDIGGRCAREIVEGGRDAGLEFARDWLRSTFGDYAVKHFRPLEVTSWLKSAFVEGSFSSANPGMAAARAALQPIADGRLAFAGEALHPSLWGTVAGAWDSGEAAATALCRTVKVT